MKPERLALFRCPHCHGDLEASGPVDRDGGIRSGALTCTVCNRVFPIRDAIPRFVPQENYSSTFGFQWNRFRRTQLDSHSGLPISRDRFYRQSRWRPEDLAGRRVLDVGCGAGRFTEIALAAGAHVVSMDYSDAVDACQANFEGHERLTVVQGDVYHLPFRPGAFDFVYCFGVLQHTPDVKRAFLALAEPLAAGGQIAVDLYPRLAANIIWPKYWLRPLTRRIPPPALLRVVEPLVRLLFPASLALGRVPRVGRKLRHALPIVNYEGILPLSREQLEHWAVLDTFDMLAPRYDQPQTPDTLRSWFREAGYEAVEVVRDGLVVGRGRRPNLDAEHIEPQAVPQQAAQA